MPRYFTRPRAWTGTDFGQPYDAPDHAEAFRPHLDVPDHEATDTGLLDKDGNSIWRAPNPIGFVWE